MDIVKNELASIIIPTYNAEATIERCLNSIVNQTYQHIEIIICDDCSTDNTWKILEKWKQNDVRICIMQNDENRKAAYTRNKCIEKAKGAYIVQLDDDDYSVIDRIEKQVNFLRNNPEYDFVSSGVYLFDENGIYGNIVNATGYAPVAKDFLWNSPFLNPTVTFRKEALIEVGGYRVAEETIRGQDYDLYMRMYERGHYGFILPECLTYYYRGKYSYSKCKYKYRINEVKIRYKNYKKMGLLPIGYLFMLKPLMLGLIPIKLIEGIKYKR